MRMQELIRGILDLIDNANRPEPQATAQISIMSAEPIAAVVAEPEGTESPFTHTGDDINRFKQIVDLADKPNPNAQYSNEPNEQYADIEAVTTNAGGGLNGPKHPHDIRVKDPSAYPHTQDHSAELEPHSNGTGLHGALINAMRGL
jgi:hypothetical protein